MNDSIPISQLTPDELRALEGTDRIKDGMVQLQPVIPVPAPQAAAAVAPQDIPDPSPEVIAAAQALSQVLLNPEVQVEDAAAVAEQRRVKAELDADKTAFLAHVLGAERFIKSYSFYGGQVVFSFHTLTGGEHERCTRQALSEVVAAGLTAEEKSSKQVQRLLQLLMVSATHEILRYSGTLDSRVSLPDDLLQKEEALKALPGAVYHLLRASFERFDRRVMELTGLAESPDFWTAAPAV